MLKPFYHFIILTSLLTIYSSIVSARSTDDICSNLKDWDGIVWWQRKASVVAAKDAPGGKVCLKFEALQPSYTLLNRTYIFPRDISHVTLKGEAMTDNMKKGNGSIDGGRILIQFLDKNGDMVGGWPKDAYRKDGTTEWEQFEKTYKVPKNARAIVLMIGGYLTTGTMYARDLVLDVRDVNGEVLKSFPSNDSRTDTSDWSVFKVEKEDSSRPLVYDFSQLMHAPAGKFGPVRSVGPDFAFDNGQKIRFWGSNEAFNILDKSKEELAALAEHYHRNGVNIVRLHHLDNGWSDPLVNIFDHTKDDTQHLDAKRMDAMDFFVAECKKRGVYIHLDLLCTRKFKAGDNVRDWDKLDYGAKIAAHYNPRIIELQKHFAALLLNRVNPYTGLKYAEDPAIAMLAIINESSLFWPVGFKKFPQSYIDELQGLFENWCKKNNKEVAAGGIQKLLYDNNKDLIQFLLETQNAYFDEMKGYIKNELKYTGLIAGSNHWNGSAIDNMSNSRDDFVDRHEYWDHPQGGFSASAIFNNTPMSKDLVSPSKNLIGYFAKQRVKDKPFAVTEWNYCWPNEYITEGALLVGSHAAFQDFNAMFTFGMEPWEDKMSSAFNFGNKPHARIPFWATSISFLRGDVKPGPETVLVKPIPDTVYFMNQDIDQELILKRRLSTVYSADVPKLPTGKDAKSQKKISDVVESDDGQLMWKKSGFFSVNSPKTQGVTGFIEGEDVKLKDVSIKINNDFGQIIVVSLDNKPIADSSRVLVCATSRAENTGQVYRAFRKGLKNQGSAPILIEKLNAEITFTSENKAGKEATVHVVDEHYRRSPVNFKLTNSSGKAPVLKLGKTTGMAFEVIWE